MFKKKEIRNEEHLEYQKVKLEILINALNYELTIISKTFVQVNLENTTIPIYELIRELEKKILITALTQSNGNQKKASLILGINPSSLHGKIRKHGFI